MNDRVMPVIVICFVISSLGYYWRQEDAGVAPQICEHYQVEGAYLACGKEDDALGARALLVGKKLDINQVTAADLKQIPRLSWKVANAIVAYRESRGGKLNNLDCLLDVKGVGPKTLDKLKVYTQVYRKETRP